MNEARAFHDPFSMKMKKALFVATLGLFFAACAKHRPAPVGMADWTSVMAAAESMVLKGDASEVIKHSDTSGIPEQTLAVIEKSLAEWRGISSELKLIATVVMTPIEFAAFRKEQRQDWPEDMRSAIRESKWNIQPEKIIVYKFEETASKTSETAATEKSNKPTAKASFSLGVFQRNGALYFATGYTDDGF